MPTPRWGLELIEDNPDNPEVAYNNSMVRADVVLHLSVIDRDLTAPPGSPAEGDAYIPAATATGDWAGHEGEVTYWAQAWLFIVLGTKNEGTKIWVQDEDFYILWNGTAYVDPDALTTLATDSWTASATYQQTEVQDLGNKLDEAILAMQKMGVAG